MDIFRLTLTRMLVMFSFILAGFVLRKCNILPDIAASVLSRLENYIFVPALILDTFIKYCRLDTLGVNFSLILYCLLLLAVGLCISIPLAGRLSEKENVVRSERRYSKNIYKYALTFANFSFMGNSIVLGVLGSEGLFDYLLFTLPLNIAVYTWGILILIPENSDRKSIFHSMLNPVFIAIISGIILGVTDSEKILPAFVLNTLSDAKSCMGPVAMLLTGFVIGGYNLSGLLGKKQVYIASAMRLVVIPAVMLLLLGFIGADKHIMTLALFAFATPLGLNTVVFPAAYGVSPETGASMAMISHILSIITIPFMYLIFVV